MRRKPSSQSCIAGLLLLPFLMLIFLAENTAAQDVVVNEVLASNGSGITDEDGDAEPWIELYNAGDEPLDLSGYGLSDDYDRPHRWVFPEVTLKPDSFLLIWASGKDRNDPGAPLHANFRVAQAGEEVIITCPEGDTTDELNPTTIPTNISYGRKPDGANQWYFFSEPTPGNGNISQGYTGITGQPEINLQFIENRKYQVEIDHPEEEAFVYYSTDGSEPNESSAMYTAPFQFEAPPDSLMYIRTTPVEAAENGFGWYTPEGSFHSIAVVRAIAQKQGYLPSSVQTQSNIGGYSRLPVISIATHPASLFSDSIGIYVPGDIYNELGWNHDNWWGAPNANYHQRGPAWEREATIELFFPDGAYHNQNIGLRIHGGGSRTMPLKTLRVYARNKYGQSEVDFDVFGNGSTGYKRLLFRNSGQDVMAAMFRDAAIQTIVKHLNFNTQAYQPSIAFINGEYWGIHNIRERYDKHYLERVHQIDPENIDLLSRRYLVKEGDNKHYLATLDYIEQNGLEEDHHYDYILTRIDTENFIDYKIAHIFSANTDWPHSNIDFWRLRTEKYLPNAPYGHDGRWRWLFYDLDFGFGFLGGSQYQHNTLAYATSEEQWDKANPPWSTSLLRSFLENERFRIRFINRFADLLNTCFLEERTTRVIMDMKNVIKPEIPNHIARWGHPSELNKWENNANRMLEFSKRRPSAQRKHIREKFDIEDDVIVELDVSNTLKGHIRINTIEIVPCTPGVSEKPYPWNGKYFKDIPIEVEAIPAPGYSFSHWEGSYNGTENPVRLSGEEDVELTAHFEKTGEDVLLHYWLFDTAIPNDTPLEYLASTHGALNTGTIEYNSCLEGYPFEAGHPDRRKASMERRNQPTPINYRWQVNDSLPYHAYEDTMRGIQVKQPMADHINENTMIFHLPAKGYKDLVFAFAAKDEGAADRLIVDYQVKPGEWTSEGLPAYDWSLESSYQYYEADFSGIPDVANNADLKVRIRFEADNPEADEGNRVTFNNVTLEGTVMDAYTIHASADGHGKILPSGRIPVYQGDDKHFRIVPTENHEIEEILVDGSCVIDQLTALSGDTVMYAFSNVDADHEIFVTFKHEEDSIDNQDNKLCVYPNPANDRFTIITADPMREVKLSRLSGQLVACFEPSAAKEYSIDTTLLKNGVYILHVRTDGGSVSSKVMLMR
ncbi:MAG: CotH kinase family protein [Bacteroidales bacterium]